jgi:hypothetical protein
MKKLNLRADSFDLFPVIGSLSLNNEAFAIVIFEIVKFSVEENRS